MGLGLIEFLMSEYRSKVSGGEGLGNGSRSLMRQGIARGGGEGRGIEGVRTMLEHFLREPIGNGTGVDAEVLKHCTGFPAAEELHGACINVSTEEGRGAAGVEAAG